MTVITGEIREERPTARAIPADTFAARLVLVRLHAGNLSIVEAAERIGVTNQSWGNWERGSAPRDKDEHVKAISDTFGIDRDWLMWGGPLAPPPSRRRRQEKADNGSYHSRVRPARTFRAPDYPESMRRPAILRDPLAVG